MPTTITPGDRVTFTDEFAALLLKQVEFRSVLHAQLRREITAGFRATRIIRGCRVNVTIDRPEGPSYRTFAARDLKVMA